MGEFSQHLGARVIANLKGLTATKIATKSRSRKVGLKLGVIKEIKN